MAKQSSGDSRKKYRDLERVVKGAANHRRIEIMELLARKPELSIFDISNELGANFKTISQHVKSLVVSGLVMKRSDGASVRHALTERGQEVFSFLKKLL